MLNDAAVKNGRSVSEEAEYRLLQSFEHDRVRQIVREELDATREKAQPISAMMDGSPVKIHVTGPSDRMRY